MEYSYIPKQSQAIKEALGGKEIRLTKGSLLKLVGKDRVQYIPQIKETLENPDLIIRDNDNIVVLAKQINDRQYFTSINLETQDYLVSISNAPKKANILKNKVENGAKILYQSPNAKSIFYTDTLLQAGKSPTNKIDEGIIPQNNSLESKLSLALQQKFKYDATKAKDLLEWHKDSSYITKDEEGLPKVFYHGSRADKKFAVFDGEKIHSGYGFWFATNPKDKAVQENITRKDQLYKVFLKVKNPFVLEDLGRDNLKEFEKVFNRDFTKALEAKESIEILENLVKKDLNVEDAYFISPYDWEIYHKGKWKLYRNMDFYNALSPKAQKEVDTFAQKDINRGQTMIHLPRAYQDSKEAEQVLKNIQDLGYDGIDNYGEIIVFNPNQIKAVDNKGSVIDTKTGELKTARLKDRAREDFTYFNDKSPNIYHSNPHLGSGLVGGSVAGIENDEEGKVSINPTNFLLGLGGGSIGSKGIAKGFKILKDNPHLKQKLQEELANTLSQGWESAIRQYPLLQSLEPRYIVKNERGREIQAKAVLKEVEEQEAKGLYNVAYNGKNATRVFKDLKAVDNHIQLLKGYHDNTKDRGKAAKHIKEHFAPFSEGYISEQEYLRLGKDLRAYLEKYQEPFMENGASIYEWFNDKGTKFRLVVSDRNSGLGHKSVPPSADSEIITYFSNRFSQKGIDFKNPKVQQDYDKEINKNRLTIPQIQEMFKKVFLVKKINYPLL